MVEPNHADLAKNPAYRPANERPCKCGVFLFMAKNGLQQGPAQLAIAMRATPGIS
jgi:hypothetical protein